MTHSKPEKLRMKITQCAQRPIYLSTYFVLVYWTRSDHSRPLRRIALSNPMSLPAVKIDKYSFIKSMKNMGRAYQKQAKELVFISQLFVRAQNQTFDPDANQSLVT
jgi:hypothetical protein